MIKIYYPSGNVLHINGSWKGPGNINGLCAILIIVDGDSILPGGTKIEKGAAFIGDIRGIYQDETSGSILYNPRDHTEGMDNWAVKWLNEHPEWPLILELSL